MPDAVLREGDILLIEGDHAALDRIGRPGEAQRHRTGANWRGRQEARGCAIEAVIGEHSSLIGWSAQRLALFDRFDINLLAVSRKGQRLTERLGTITLRLGDVIVLQGNPDALPELLRDLGLLPLAERPILLGSVRRGLVPVLILLAAMGATALGRRPGADRLLRRGRGDGALQVVPLARGLRRRSTGRSWSCSPR